MELLREVGLMGVFVSLGLRSVMDPGMETILLEGWWLLMPWTWRFCCTVRCRCDHLPVGVSGQKINIDMAVVVMRMKGTMKDTLQAT